MLQKLFEIMLRSTRSVAVFDSSVSEDEEE
jgi:hypothetical protein